MAGKRGPCGKPTAVPRYRMARSPVVSWRIVVQRADSDTRSSSMRSRPGMQPNRMKARIKAGEPVFGVSVMFPSPQIVEMIGELGFDWVLIDCEHGSMSPESAELMCLAAERRGITPIVRPEINRPEVLMRYLDRGAMGLQVPHVNTKAEAIAAVRAMKYHPLGDRGLARGQRSTGFGITGGSIARYTEGSNSETPVCGQ